ncbi:MAG: asparagine synthase (glutamine-hydrolyzing) [Planctomycetota bacterium]
MCGIAGLVRKERLEPADPERVARMTASLRHRGPDASGLLERKQVVLGHRRLSIVDLSDRAGQPMLAPDGPPGGVAVVYNGEVYNHLDLRRELSAEGYRFGTQSDTEVVVQGWRAWGEALPEKLNGMFAIAVWDDPQRTLFLARDRYGQKPLYYAQTPDGGLVFASELRALLVCDAIPRQLDRKALAKYLAFDCFPGESSPLIGVKKLLPGHSLTWKNGRITIRRYWKRTYGGCTLRPREAAERLWELFADAVERRLMADVPLGVFLSGGVDSSAVLAAMAERTDPAQIQTFAIGFDDPTYDESPAARLVANHFGVTHHEKILTPQSLEPVVEEVLDHLDEPLADVSIVPTYVLSKFARERVTVALGGDGGDELLAGYDTFVAERVARPYLWVPKAVRAGVAQLVELLPPSDRDMSLQFKARRFVRGLDPDLYTRQQRWFGSFLPDEAAGTILGGPRPDEVYEDLARLDRPAGEQAGLELWTSYYLPDDVLTKVDRATMAVSLEARAPLLDPVFGEFVHSLPFRYKLHGFQRKWIFKRALRGKLPSSILRRKKQGFRAPSGAWLRGPLREDLQRLLDPQRLHREGVLHPSRVARLLHEHLSGAQDHRKQLWALYVLERWREHYGLE